MPTGSNPAIGVPPGGTGSMQAQRFNALNHANRNLQQSQALRDQEQLERTGSGFDQFTPSTRLRASGSWAGPRGFTRAGLPLNRQYVIDALRQRGLTADEWRVVNRGGNWWYWTPEERWMVYRDGDWAAYSNRLGSDEGRQLDYRAAYPDQLDPNQRDDRLYSGRVPDVGLDAAFPEQYPAERWRLVRHEGRLWYWTPEHTWLFLSGGRWIDWNRRATMLRDRADGGESYGVGYRGEDVLEPMP